MATAEPDPRPEPGTVRVSGTVTLDVEATVPADELEDEQHAENILKGGFFDTRTKGIAVEVDAMERRPGRT